MNRPPTEIGEESTVPGTSIDTRASVVTFPAVMPVGAWKSFRRSGGTPKRGQGLCAGTGGGDSTGPVSVAVLSSVDPPLEQLQSRAAITSRGVSRLSIRKANLVPSYPGGCPLRHDESARTADR